MEARAVAAADADVRKHVARGNEVAAGNAEHLEGVAVLLVDRVHDAELHRAETSARAQERIACREPGAGGVARVDVGSAVRTAVRIVEVDRLFELPDELERRRDGALAAETEVGVLHIDRLA